MPVSLINHNSPQMPKTLVADKANRNIAIAACVTLSVALISQFAIAKLVMHLNSKKQAPSDTSTLDKKVEELTKNLATANESLTQTSKKITDLQGKNTQLSDELQNATSEEAMKARVEKYIEAGILSTEFIEKARSALADQALVKVALSDIREAQGKASEAINQSIAAADEQMKTLEENLEARLKAELKDVLKAMDGTLKNRVDTIDTLVEELSPGLMANLRDIAALKLSFEEIEAKMHQFRTDENLIKGEVEVLPAVPSLEEQYAEIERALEALSVELSQDNFDASKKGITQQMAHLETSLDKASNNLKAVLGCQTRRKELIEKLSKFKISSESIDDASGDLASRPLPNYFNAKTFEDSLRTFDEAIDHVEIQFLTQAKKSLTTELRLAKELYQGISEPTLSWLSKQTRLKFIIDSNATQRSIDDFTTENLQMLSIYQDSLKGATELFTRINELIQASLLADQCKTYTFSTEINEAIRELSQRSNNLLSDINAIKPEELEEVRTAFVPLKTIVDRYERFQEIKTLHQTFKVAYNAMEELNKETHKALLANVSKRVHQYKEQLENTEIQEEVFIKEADTLTKELQNGIKTWTPLAKANSDTPHTTETPTTTA